MKQKLLTFFLFSLPLIAEAAGTATVACDGYTPTIFLTYATGANAGLPGVTYVGMLSPDNNYGLMLDLSNNWSSYSSGQLIPNGAYDSGLPSVTTTKIKIPSSANPYTTADFVNYSLYAGHGALTAHDQELIKTRRSALDRAKQVHLAKGAWLQQYQTDDMFKLTLAQKNMTDGSKYNFVLTIPFIDCGNTFSGG